MGGSGGKRFVHDKGKDGCPLVITLSKDKYKWCACGKTKKPPWCDGTCKGGKPVKFEIKKKAEVRICNCGLTTTPPYCDGSAHDKIDGAKSADKPGKKPGKTPNDRKGGK